MMQAAKHRCLPNTVTGRKLFACGRWPEHCPGWVPEFQDLMKSEGGHGCSGLPRSWTVIFRWRSFTGIKKSRPSSFRVRCDLIRFSLPVVIWKAPVFRLHTTVLKPSRRSPYGQQSASRRSVYGRWLKFLRVIDDVTANCNIATRQPSCSPGTQPTVSWQPL